MNSPGPVHLLVDLPQLHSLRTELSTLLGALAELDDNGVTADGRSMGDDVAGAVHRFTDRWRDGRQRITEHLSACLKIVDLAIAGYSTTENDLQRVALPGVLSDLEGVRP